MNQLIKIESRTIGAISAPAVNLRELHKFLGSKQKFSDWAKSRLEESMAEKGADFTDHKFMIGRTKQIDFYVTLEIAKHIGMLERNTKGKEIRTYFIAAEKELRETRAHLPADIFAMLQAILKARDKGDTAEDILRMILPTGNYAEIAANGQPKLGFQRAAWRTIGRLKEGAKLNRMCGKWLQLTLDIYGESERLGELN